jgi:hypothetical protein
VIVGVIANGVRIQGSRLGLIGRYERRGGREVTTTSPSKQKDEQLTLTLPVLDQGSTSQECASSRNLEGGVRGGWEELRSATKAARAGRVATGDKVERKKDRKKDSDAISGDGQG